MKIKVLIDMNLSPSWAKVLTERGFESQHWSQIGAANAADHIIFDYAIEHGYVVFTHDLDFGTLLAHTHSRAPSVLQARVQDVSPLALADTIVSVLLQHQQELVVGALVTILRDRNKVRILPL